MSASVTESDAVTPRWLHAWAALTACATFVLLLLGSLVTTRGAGMADELWPTYPWHLLLIDWNDAPANLIIEHLHRLAGYLVGIFAIVLAAGLWLREPRRWVRWLGTTALAGVCLQGVLGGLRVRLDPIIGPDQATMVAIVHGCFAQIVFALLVAVALVTSRSWRQSRPADSGNSLRWLPVAVATVVFMQIVFGAIVRHTYSMSGLKHHLTGAFAVTIAVVWLIRETWRSEDRPVRRAGYVLFTVTVLQLLMGIEVFMGRFFTVRSALHQTGVRTVHVLLGFLLFSSVVSLAALARRGANREEESFDAQARRHGDAETVASETPVPASPRPRVSASQPVHVGEGDA